MTPEELIEQKRWESDFLRIAKILENGSEEGEPIELKGVTVLIKAPTPLGFQRGRDRAFQIMLERVGPRPGKDAAGELLVMLAHAATLVGIVGAISPAALSGAVPAVKKIVGYLKSSGLAPELGDAALGAVKEKLMQFTVKSAVTALICGLVSAVAVLQGAYGDGVLTNNELAGILSALVSTAFAAFVNPNKVKQ